VRFVDSIVFPLLPKRFRLLHDGIALIAYVAFVLALSDGVMGLHRVARWRAVLAVVFTFVALMAVFAAIVRLMRHLGLLG
jgi:hypothetical protein